MADEAAPKPNQSNAKVFISYSRNDIGFADRLEAALRVRGFEPLIDRTDIYAFEKWWERIEALIRRADTVVFVISPDAVASEIALKEVAEAASLTVRARGVAQGGRQGHPRVADLPGMRSARPAATGLRPRLHKHLVPAARLGGCVLSALRQDLE